MKQYYFFFLLLLLPSIAFSQARHDIKLDLMRAYLNTAFLSYEASPSKHFGIELGFGYEWGKLELFSNGVASFENYRSYAQNIGQLLLMGKLYPFRHVNGDGLFLGGYFIEKYELSRDPDYSSAYKMAYGTEPQNSQNLWSGLGGSVGYKKVFKNRLLLELGFSADLNLAAWFSTKAKRTYDFGGTIQAKVGYRIANPKREGRLKE